MRSLVYICLVLLALATLASANSSAYKGDNLRHVVFISGGSNDDYLSSILLTTMENVNLEGVILSNSDDISYAAMDLQWKIFTFLNKTQIPIALSDARGWNPFPYEYRTDSILFDERFPREYGPNPKWPPYPSGERLLEKLISEAIANGTQVTLLVTSPITPLNNVLQDKPELEKGIKELIFMGGAIYVKGNLDPDTIPKEIANSNAEWNIFWDPVSTASIFENTSFPITLFPLDVTNKVKVVPFISRLSDQRSFNLSEIIYDSYNQTRVDKDPYLCMWNSLTTCYIIHPEFFDNPKIMKLKVITEGYEQGSIVQDPSGREVSVILNIRNPDQFYDYVLGQLRQ